VTPPARQRVRGRCYRSPTTFFLIFVRTGNDRPPVAFGPGEQAIARDICLFFLVSVTIPTAHYYYCAAQHGHGRPPNKRGALSPPVNSPSPMAPPPHEPPRRSLATPVTVRFGAVRLAVASGTGTLACPDRIRACRRWGFGKPPSWQGGDFERTPLPKRTRKPTDDASCYLSSLCSKQ
jgi:hypothetical protein